MFKRIWENVHTILKHIKELSFKVLRLIKESVCILLRGIKANFLWGFKRIWQKIIRIKKLVRDFFCEFEHIRKDTRFLFYLILCLVVTLVIFATFPYFNEKDGIYAYDTYIEFHGLLYDVIFFGVILTIYDLIRKRKDRIERLYEELDDYKQWDEHEGIYRKVGIITRLVKMNADIPDLSFYQLPRALFKDISLKGVVLHSANLHEAKFFNVDLENANFGDALSAGIMFVGEYESKMNLQGTGFITSDSTRITFRNVDLSYANLTGFQYKYVNQGDRPKFINVNFHRAILHLTDLRGVDMRTAENLTDGQVKSAFIDNDTKLPSYLPPVEHFLSNRK